jgi:hypothetical protein
MIVILDIRPFRVLSLATVAGVRDVAERGTTIHCTEPYNALKLYQDDRQMKN